MRAPSLQTMCELGTRAALDHAERRAGLSGLADEALPLVMAGVANFAGPGVAAALNLPSEISNVAKIVKIVSDGGGAS